jgi:hypothetical protein
MVQSLDPCPLARREQAGPSRQCKVCYWRGIVSVTASAVKTAQRTSHLEKMQDTLDRRRVLCLLQPSKVEADLNQPRGGEQ